MNNNENVLLGLIKDKGKCKYSYCQGCYLNYDCSIFQATGFTRENINTRYKIALRIAYEKELITEEDIFEGVL